MVALLVDANARRSAWARETIERSAAPVVAVATELMVELGEKDESAPELLAVVRRPQAGPEDLPEGDDAVVLVLDRPTSPGNVGSLARSADALGAHAVVVTGHAADPWDPRALRASTGSMFALPVIAVDDPAPVLGWRDRRRSSAGQVTIVGTDEGGETLLPHADLHGSVVLVVGNETRGMSLAWSEACDVVVSIPMTGSASSLNAAASGSIALYELARRRWT
ncbi:TrmH family RNA methyltransferase [Aeromicrobium halocynthiae]|uniref:TrmH family RNA methyltransferase n=2 Tax=Aeromicrobium halocynthiae TaxID=560557 RepID=A0ABP5HNS0_9ACTN